MDKPGPSRGKLLKDSTHLHLMCIKNACFQNIPICYPGPFLECFSEVAKNKTTHPHFSDGKKYVPQKRYVPCSKSFREAAIFLGAEQSYQECQP